MRPCVLMSVWDLLNMIKRIFLDTINQNVISVKLCMMVQVTGLSFVCSCYLFNDLDHFSWSQWRHTVETESSDGDDTGKSVQ